MTDKELQGHMPDEQWVVFKEWHKEIFGYEVKDLSSLFLQAKLWFSIGWERKY